MQAFAQTLASTHPCKETYRHTNRGSTDLLSQRFLDCVLLHSWPLSRVLFICVWSCLCCGQSERQTLQLLQWCVNILGMFSWAHKAAGPAGCYRLLEGVAPLQPRRQSIINITITITKNKHICGELMVPIDTNYSKWNIAKWKKSNQLFMCPFYTQTFTFTANLSFNKTHIQQLQTEILYWGW